MFMDKAAKTATGGAEKIFPVKFPVIFPVISRNRENNREN
jgi:hypothetical protein